MQIRSRDHWAVDRPAKGALGPEDVRFLLVHHSASSNDYAEDEVPSILRGFFDYHTGPQKGWADIAYNFLIDRFGGVWEGRTGSIEGPVAGDATGGNQGFSQLVCLIGNFSTEPPSTEASTALVAVLAWLADRHAVSTAPGAEAAFESRGSNRWVEGQLVKTRTIAGHRDMSVTSCPGDVLYSYVIGSLASDVDAFRASVALTTTTRASPSSTSETRILAPSPQETSSRSIPTAAAKSTLVLNDPQPQASEPSSGLIRGLAASAFAAVVAVVIRRRIANARSHEHAELPE